MYIGAVSALAAMTVLSAAIGFALPNLLPRAYTHYAATVLVRVPAGRHNAMHATPCSLHASFAACCPVLCRRQFAYFGFRLLKDAYDMDTTQ